MNDKTLGHPIKKRDGLISIMLLVYGFLNAILFSLIHRILTEHEKP